MTVNVQIKGVPIAISKMIKDNKQAIELIGKSMTTVGNYMVGEVKESIAGRKAEPTSVKTGNYLGKIYSFETINSSTIYTPVSYAKYLEYGTSRIKERRHFRNSLNRNKEKINAFINSQIKKL